MNADPYRYFRIEAGELVEKLSRGALDFEKESPDPEKISVLLRHAHTLKGAARIVKQTRISELSHALEEILTAYRDRPSSVPSNAPANMLQMTDEISRELRTLAKPEDAEPASRTAPAAEPERRTIDEDIFDVLRIKAGEMDVLIRNLGELQVQVSGLASQISSLKPNSQSRSDGELSSGIGKLHDSMRARLEGMDRLLASAYDRAAGMRLVPAGSILVLLERTARDAAVATGKRVHFSTSGGDIRLDAHILRVLRDALIHLVRNAVAHGIEAPPDRAAAGKSQEGDVRVAVERRGDQAIFRCADDGSGVNVQLVREQALKRGLLASSESQVLTAQAAFQLLLQGGITTVQKPSEIAGRGVGLDIVRRSVQALKGTLSAETQPGRGTRIEISVPVSVEALDVLEIRNGSWDLAIPMQSTRQVLRVAARDVESRPDGEVILLGNEALPFVPLSRILDSGSGALSRTAPAILVKSPAGTVAVAVDSIGVSRRVVMRALPGAVHSFTLAAGAFIDPHGRPRLVLDPSVLVSTALAHRAAVPQPSRPAVPPVLVIDDSLTTRMLEQGILESAGFEVDTASSGEEALEKARRKHYGLFLVDIEMPGIDGFEFIRLVNSDSQIQRTPSIVVTSREFPADRARAEQLGVEAYIVKSRFDQDLLLGTIRRILD